MCFTLSSPEQEATAEGNELLFSAKRKIGLALVLRKTKERLRRGVDRYKSSEWLRQACFGCVCGNAVKEFFNSDLIS